MQKFHVSSSRWEYQSTRWFVWEMSHQEMNESEKTMVENGKSKSWTLNAFIRDNEMQPCDHMRWWWWYSLLFIRDTNDKCSKSQQTNWLKQTNERLKTMKTLYISQIYFNIQRMNWWWSNIFFIFPQFKWWKIVWKRKKRQIYEKSNFTTSAFLFENESTKSLDDVN